MDAHEYVFVFQNLNILCIFSDRFFDPVFGVDRFNDRSGSGNFGGSDRWNSSNMKRAGTKYGKISSSMNKGWH
jgi:hypothetical protein